MFQTYGSALEVQQRSGMCLTSCSHLSRQEERLEELAHITLPTQFGTAMIRLQQRCTSVHAWLSCATGIRTGWSLHDIDQLSFQITLATNDEAGSAPSSMSHTIETPTWHNSAQTVEM